MNTSDVTSEPDGAIMSTSNGEDLQLSTSGQLQFANELFVSSMTMMLIYTGVGVVGIIGNLLVIIVFTHSAEIKMKITNMLIIHQSVIDMVASIFVILHTYIDDMSLVPRGLAAELFCRIWITRCVQWTMFYISTCNLLSLTLERFLGIVHPLVHDKHVSKPRVRIVMLLAWLFGIAYSGSISVPTATMVGDKCTTYTVFVSGLARKMYGTIIFLINQFGPVIVIVYCYGNILYVIRKNDRQMRDFSHKERDEKARRTRNDVIKSLLIVSICYILCWLPNSFYFWFYCLGIKLSFNHPVYHLTNVAVNMNCCVNPIIYSIQFKQFQSGFVSMFCRCCPRSEKNRSGIELSQSVQSTTLSVQGG